MGIMEEIKAQEMNVETILKRSSLSFAEKNVIIEAVKSLAKSLCSAKATQAAFDAYLKEAFPEEYRIFMGTYFRSATYNRAFLESMRRMNPHFGEK